VLIKVGLFKYNEEDESQFLGLSVSFSEERGLEEEKH